MQVILLSIQGVISIQVLEWVQWGLIASLQSLTVAYKLANTNLISILADLTHTNALNYRWVPRRITMYQILGSLTKTINQILKSRIHHRVQTGMIMAKVIFFVLNRLSIINTGQFSRISLKVQSQQWVATAFQLLVNCRREVTIWNDKERRSPSKKNQSRKMWLQTFIKFNNR